MAKLLFILLIAFSPAAFSQSTEQIMSEIEDDLTPGSDIFSDFNEDLESAQVLEDERFYRYGRFFSVNLGGGFTTFTGNRGRAFDDNHPSFHLSVNYFLDFQQAILLGIEYSKHTAVIDTVVNLSQELGNLGAVSNDMIRLFTGYKYYLDTTDLGTAITYSNPHLIGRLEYWYQTYKYIDRPTLPRNVGGGIGTGLGGGFEFPVEIKNSYISVEALYHRVNFFDKFTQDYRQVPDNANSKFGFDDLTGDVWTVMVTYNFTW